MSDRSELAEAARRCEQALIAARRAAFNAAAGELVALADALQEAADAQADTATILERAAPREPRPMEPRAAGLPPSSDLTVDTIRAAPMR